MEKRKNTVLQSIAAVILSLLMVVGMISVSDMTGKTIHAASLSNPTVVNDSSMEAGQKTTWDCVWFGSYPQTEIVESTSDCGSHEWKYSKTSDYEQNRSLYLQLSNATGWDSNGDITLDGTKYRRIQKSDAAGLGAESGEYQWNTGGIYHYFRYEPIKWRVLNVDGNQAILLADKALDSQAYSEHNGKKAITWESSTIRSWLNGYDSSENTYGTDYSSKNFIDSAFTSEEQDAVLSTELDNSTTGPYSSKYGGNDTTDKIFFLSAYDVYNTDVSASYGFYEESYSICDEARGCQSSTYAKAMGIATLNSTPYLGNCCWMFRSPGSESCFSARVDYDGKVNNGGFYATYDNLGVRPALTLNLSSSSWSSAGTVSSDGTTNEISYGLDGDGSDKDAITEETASLSNPRAVSDSSMEAGQKTTWDCVWFGSYPQTEIVDSASDCGSTGKSWSQTSDYEADSSLYSQLESATGWDSNGDITLDGTKYRRIQQSDATYDSTGSDDYYDWGNSSATYHYFRYEPIKWRVLNVDGNQALLLADETLDDQKFVENKNGKNSDVPKWENYEPVGNSYTCWENSTIRSWLNGYDNVQNIFGFDYTSKNFIDTAFTSEEQKAVLSTELENSGDYVFLLSYDELRGTDMSISYGFCEGGYPICDEASRSKSSTYAKAMGIRNDQEDLGNCDWWIRSLGFDFMNACVNSNGFVNLEGYDSEEFFNIGVRPALTLNLSSSSWSSAGTVCSDEIINAKADACVVDGHTWDKGTVTKEPTCKEKGEKQYTCTVCGETKTEEIAKTDNHTPVEVKSIQATNTTKGLTSGSICSVCGTVLEKQEVTPVISEVTLYRYVNKSYTLTSGSKASWKIKSGSKYASLKKAKLTVKKAGTVKVYDSKSKQYVTIHIKTPTISTKTSVSVAQNRTLQLSSTSTPEATVKYYVVSSKYKKYATVTVDGKVTGVKPGTCYIYAKANGVKKKIKVTVKSNYETLYEYINTYGTKDSEGNKCISYTDSKNGMAYEISYEAKYKRFIFSTGNDHIDFAMYIKRSGASKAEIFDMYSKPSDYRNYKFAAEGHISNIKTFTAYSNISIDSYDWRKGFSKSSCQAMTCDFMDIGMSGWSTLLEKADLEFSDLGFSKYKLTTYDSIVNLVKYYNNL